MLRHWVDCVAHATTAEAERVAGLLEEGQRVASLASRLLLPGWQGVAVALREWRLEGSDSESLLFTLATPEGVEVARFREMVRGACADAVRRCCGG